MSDTIQRMTYHERERLKWFADTCNREGDAQSMAVLLIIIAHWMRSGTAPFEQYAGDWIADDRDREPPHPFREATQRLAEYYPQQGDRK